MNWSDKGILPKYKNGGYTDVTEDYFNNIDKKGPKKDDLFLYWAWQYQAETPWKLFVFINNHYKDY